MLWKQPHISKIYEALTAIADNRIELVGDNKAKCYSSSKGKFYEIEFDPKTNSIVSNDNACFYTDSISYPMIAFLIKIGKIKCDQSFIDVFKDIYWKDINQKFKNDYDKSLEFVFDNLKDQDIDELKIKAKGVYDQVCRLKLKSLGEKIKPPAGY